MGYTTEFSGSITVDPPLNPQEIEFLRKFAGRRRMNRKNGPYFVDGTGDFGQGNDPDIINSNSPPEGQPGLWCQWVPDDSGASIEWDGGEKFYNAAEWMAYIINHFIGDRPLAKLADPERFAFIMPHRCDGEIAAKGEDTDDHWLLVVRNNVVTTRQCAVVAIGPEDTVEG